ncbi:MAG: DinB family protein [Caldilineaceae bacterium]|nr:DinB family protein [Caldilineaceae bacterium]
MLQQERNQLVLKPLPDYDLEVGYALAALEECRQRTREKFANLPEALIDWTPPGWANSIGSLLYHIALIEADWLYCEILVRDFPAEVIALFPYDVRTEDGNLTVVAGLTLAEHWRRLDQVRSTFLEEMRSIGAEDFRRVRELPPYDVTPIWVIHHLIQHESEHRGEMGMGRTLAESRAIGSR